MKVHNDGNVLKCSEVIYMRCCTIEMGDYQDLTTYVHTHTVHVHTVHVHTYIYVRTNTYVRMYVHIYVLNSYIQAYVDSSP